MRSLFKQLVKQIYAKVSSYPIFLVLLAFAALLFLKFMCDSCRACVSEKLHNWA